MTGLALHVVVARGTASGRLAIMLTGDGGWAAIDKQLADSFAAHGTPVVALDSRSYFSKQRDADGAARDLSRIARYYLASLGGERLVLVGYSRGADVLPFMASRLTTDLLVRVELIALLGPAPNANFKFHLIDLVSNRHRADDRMTVPEIEKLYGKKILCFYGADEKESACPALDSTKAVVVRMPGGHHFGKEYGAIGARIVEALSN
ncbi:MAG TPA: AcvB/VirJ family lysyl-phosphatidylglycerol hydrolase [Gemmatimonadaceae bacterium]|jgi:type IV secretory pathway VirJ component